MARQAKGEREKRVQHVARLMAQLQWTGQKDQRMELAVRWGVTEGAIRHYAAEAHRFLAADPGQRAALRQLLADRFFDIAERARRLKNRATGLPDFRAETEALKTYAEFTSVLIGASDGPGTPSHVEVRVIASKPDKK